MEAAQQTNNADTIIVDEIEQMKQFIRLIPRKQKRAMLRASGNLPGFGVGLRKAITAKHAARLANKENQ